MKTIAIVSAAILFLSGCSTLSEIATSKSTEDIIHFTNVLMTPN